MGSRGRYEVRFEALSPEAEAARACYGATAADATAPG
jgi:hypothetical protein